jgi:hypothetical protein
MTHRHRVPQPGTPQPQYPLAEALLAMCIGGFVLVALDLLGATDFSQPLDMNRVGIALGELAVVDDAPPVDLAEIGWASRSRPKHHPH